MAFLDIMDEATSILQAEEAEERRFIECFRAEFLHRPTVTDTQRLLVKAEERRFSGMLENIDCMY
jgi:hypothetical protein